MEDSSFISPVNILEKDIFLGRGWRWRPALERAKLRQGFDMAEKFTLEMSERAGARRRWRPAAPSWRQRQVRAAERAKRRQGFDMAEKLAGKMSERAKRLYRRLSKGGFYAGRWRPALATRSNVT